MDVLLDRVSVRVANGFLLLLEDHIDTELELVAEVLSDGLTAHLAMLVRDLNSVSVCKAFSCLMGLVPVALSMMVCQSLVDSERRDVVFSGIDGLTLHVAIFGLRANDSLGVANEATLRE